MFVNDAAALAIDCCFVAAKVQPARSLASLILASSGCSCASISGHASDFATRGGATRLPSRPGNLPVASEKASMESWFYLLTMVNST